MLPIGLRRYVYSRHIAIIVVVSIELSHCRNFTEFGQRLWEGTARPALGCLLKEDYYYYYTFCG